MRSLKSGLKQMKVDRLKTRKITKIDKHKVSAEKRNPTHSGEIYFVHPSHLIPKDKMKNYVRQKGNANPRPVAVVKANIDKTAKVAQIYGTSGNIKNISNKSRIKLHQTSLKKSSWIDTSEKDISEKTKKKFTLGVSPLNNKKSRVHPNDMKRRNKFSELYKQKKLT